MRDATKHPWDTARDALQQGQGDPLSVTWSVTCLPNWTILLLLCSLISQALQNHTPPHAARAEPPTQLLLQYHQVKCCLLACAHTVIGDRVLILGN